MVFIAFGRYSLGAASAGTIYHACNQDGLSAFGVLHTA